MGFALISTHSPVLPRPASGLLALHRRVGTSLIPSLVWGGEVWFVVRAMSNPTRTPS